jgi:hypothetical protein
MHTHIPEDKYLQKVGLVAYLVASMEGLLLFDLPRLEQMLPPELNVANLAGRTTRDLGEQLVKHATQCTDRQVAAYLEAGGNALIEVAPQRNAVLHARPATDDLGRTRLYRWRLPEAHFIDDTWLNRLVQRIDELRAELDAIRPPLT